MMTRKNSDVDYQSVSSYYNKNQLIQIVKNRDTGEMWTKDQSTISMVPNDNNVNSSFLKSFDTKDTKNHPTRAQTADLNMSHANQDRTTQKDTEHTPGKDTSFKQFKLRNQFMAKHS